MKKKAVFLDRDGVINEEVDYLHDPNKLLIIDGSGDAIKKLNDSEYLSVVVTNQSGIGRGYFTVKDFNKVNQEMSLKLLESKAKIDDIFYCPYHPTNGIGEYLIESEDRKPAPGMLLKAAQKWDIDLSKSYMVGDRISDILAGQNAGCTPILVRTGVGKQSEQELAQKDNDIKCLIADNLQAAVQFILKEKGD